jgi:O-antigen ligase
MAVSEQNPRIGLLSTTAIFMLMIVFVGNLPAFGAIFAFRGLGMISAALGLVALAATRHRQSLGTVARLAPVLKYIVGLVVMVYMSVPFSIWVGGAFGSAKTYLYSVVFLLSLLGLAKGENGLRALLNSGLLVFGMLVLGLLKNAGPGRVAIAGSSYDPNDLAYVLVSLLPLMFYYVQTLRQPVIKILGYVILLAGVLGIGLTGSRGGVVAFAMVFLMFLRFEKVSPKLIFAGILIALVGFYFLPEAFWERMSTMLHLSDDYNMQSEFGRVAIWEHSIKMFFNHALLGVGVGQFSAAGGMTGAKYMTAHNSILQVGVELGIVGLVCYLAMILLPLRVVGRHLKNPAVGNPAHRLLYKGLYLSFIAQFFGGQFISAGYFKSFYYLLVVFIVLIVIDETNAAARAVEPAGDSLETAPEVDERRNYTLKKRRTYTLRNKQD